MQSTNKICQFCNKEIYPSSKSSDVRGLNSRKYHSECAREVKLIKDRETRRKKDALQRLKKDVSKLSAPEIDIVQKDIHQLIHYFIETKYSNKPHQIENISDKVARINLTIDNKNARFSNTQLNEIREIVREELIKFMSDISIQKEEHKNTKKMITLENKRR